MLILGAARAGRALFAVVGLAAAGAAGAQQVSGNLVAGEAGSTELRAGQESGGARRRLRLGITVRETGGSVGTMRAVRDRRATQLGIVQGDVLEYFRTFENDDPELLRPAQGVRVVFPLFDEEVHVVARREIGSLADLAGKRVATGQPDSGTAVTAGLILDLAQVQPAERQPWRRMTPSPLCALATWTR